MKAEIIAVGTELLMGYVVNSNASEIAQYLLDIGVGTYYQQVVGDNYERIKEALQLASTRSDVIIVGGGLGPTRDDITKFVVADFLGVELIHDEAQLKIIKDRMSQINRDVEETDRFQALTFKEGSPMNNKAGLAIGSAYKRMIDGKTQYFIVVPGPPSEMRSVMKDSVLPYLKATLEEHLVIESLYLNFSGLGEAPLSREIDDLIVNQTNPTIALYAKPNQVTARLTCSAETKEKANEKNQQLADELLKRLSQYFIGYGENQTLAQHVYNILNERSLTLSVAESLTGGMLMEELTKIPGVSNVLKGGYVTYQTDLKERILGVNHKTIEDQTVVSAEVAKEMAERCLEKCQSDIALSLTGVAGPGPSDGFPAGTVFLGLAIKGRETKTKQLALTRRLREGVRISSVNEGLRFIWEAFK